MLKVGRLILCLLITCTSVSAQREANVWYFGAYAGLDFNSGNPVALTNGKMRSYEGCASVCDAAGNLLFYTNGEMVFNKNHDSMLTNGTLMGYNSSTQSSIIVPGPQGNGIYYIFTTDAQEDAFANGLCYSIVDMGQNAGLGAVVSKNISLLPSTCEKLTAVADRSGTGYWIVTHKWNSNSFYAYHLTSSGLNSNPVVSSIGEYIKAGGPSPYINGIGALKISPDGTKIATADGGLGFYELFSFDNATGRINERLCEMQFKSIAYSLEFSPDSKKLYAGTFVPSDIYQYDISLPSDSAILQSGIKIYSRSNGGSLQLGPDHKIYAGESETSYLDVINNPDEKGKLCNYKPNQVALGKNTLCQLGLPGFVQSIFDPMFRYKDTCSGEFTLFALDSFRTDSIRWNFGDTSSAQNISHYYHTSHLFSTTGKYSVSCIKYYKSEIDTYAKEIEIITPPKINLGADTFLCGNETIRLNAYCKDCSYEWQDGSDSSIYIVDQPGIYWVKASIGGCYDIDSIRIVRFSSLSVSLGNDTVLCPGQTLLLAPRAKGLSYVWQDSSTKVNFTVTTPGKYYVTISNKCGSFSDTISVGYYPSPHPHFGNDTIICGQPDFYLDASSENAAYQWQDESNAPRYHVTDSGVYSVTIITPCSSMEKSIHVHTNNVLHQFSIDTTVCDSITLGRIYNTGDAYAWQNGSRNAYFKADSSDTYFVTIAGYCGTVTDTFKVKVEQCECPVYVPNSFTPNADGLNESFKPSTCAARKYNMRIFNRWGEELFESNDVNNGWDGRFEGRLVPEGAYIYEISGAGKSKGFFQKAGVFYVLMPSR
jgi:gliding motility-associated-like protein